MFASYHGQTSRTLSWIHHQQPPVSSSSAPQSHYFQGLLSVSWASFWALKSPSPSSFSVVCHLQSLSINFKPALSALSLWLAASGMPHRTVEPVLHQIANFALSKSPTAFCYQQHSVYHESQFIFAIWLSLPVIDRVSSGTHSNLYLPHPLCTALIHIWFALRWSTAQTFSLLFLPGSLPG